MRLPHQSRQQGVARISSPDVEMWFRQAGQHSGCSSKRATTPERNCGTRRQSASACQSRGPAFDVARRFVLDRAVPQSFFSVQVTPPGGGRECMLVGEVAPRVIRRFAWLTSCNLLHA